MRDSVVPFAFEALPVRGAIVQLEKSWQRLQGGHDYAGAVRDVLGEAAAATTLIAQSMKARSSVTLQITGNGPLSMLVMQCTNEIAYRGLASTAVDASALPYAELVAGGRCAITVDNEDSERPYQGIVEVGGDSLAANLELYYRQSAQLPSHLSLTANAALCGGMLLQQMPGEAAVPADDWRRLGMLAATLRVSDLDGGVGSDLIGRFFSEDDVRVFAPITADFRCRCSRERVVEVLRLLGPAECNAALRDQGEVAVTCEYCGRLRRFDPVDVAGLFSDTPPTGRSDAVH